MFGRVARWGVALGAVLALLLGLPAHATKGQNPYASLLVLPTEGEGLRASKCRRATAFA
jgi:hypothetical protein